MTARACYGPRRLRPDVNLLLTRLVRADLSSDVFVATARPSDFLKRLVGGVVTIRVVSPGSFDQTRNVRHRFPVGIDVQCWAAAREQASRLDDAVLGTLVRAQELGTAEGGGYLALFDVDTPGAEVRETDAPGRCYRWQAAYSGLIRPA